MSDAAQPLTTLTGKLSTSPFNALLRHGFTTVEQMTLAFPARLKCLQGFGPAGLQEVARVFVLAPTPANKAGRKGRPSMPKKSGHA